MANGAKHGAALKRYSSLDMATRKKITVVVERTEICKNCRWAQFGEVIYCHRYPPTPVFDSGEGYVDSYQPVTGPDNYCGEFKPQLSS